MSSTRLLLISSSNVHGYGYLDQPEPFIREFLGHRKVVAFVPFAAHDHAAYTAKIAERLGRMGLDVVPHTELDRADAIFVGGGNTFRLLKTLYDRSLLDEIRRRVRSSTHKGETREERLREFHEENPTPVVGLREGTCLRVDDDRATLVGERQARIFRRGEVPFEVDPGTRIDQVVR